MGEVAVISSVRRIPVSLDKNLGGQIANHFLLFVQKKVIKENHIPLPLHPSVLAPI